VAKLLKQKEVKERIAIELAKVLTELFGMSGDEAKELLTRFKDELGDDESLLQASLVHLLNKGIKSSIHGGSRRQFTEEEVQRVIAEMKASLPQMAAALRRGLKETQKKLPRLGGPGRKGTLSPREKLRACEQVSSLHKKGQLTKMSEIFEAVAEHFRSRGKKVSARTIKRAWEDRRNVYQK
jgi:hypothetical protein